MGYGLTLLLVQLLQGTWVQPCQQSMVRKEIFHESSVRFVETKFLDENCEQGFLEFSSDGQFMVRKLESLEPSEISVAPESIEQLDPPGHSMDFTFQSVRLRPLSEAALQWMNQQSFCGKTQWRLMEFQNVSGQKCEFPGGNIRVPAEGEKRYGIFRIEEELLYLGRLSPEADGTSPEKRPKTWDSLPYQKVSVPGIFF